MNYYCQFYIQESPTFFFFTKVLDKLPEFDSLLTCTYHRDDKEVRQTFKVIDKEYDIDNNTYIYRIVSAKSIEKSIKILYNSI